MKVYIVTAGEYSDYHIKRVFLERSLAERYVALQTNSQEDFSIEEYETDDDKKFDQIRYFYAWYKVEKGRENFQMAFYTTTTLDTTEEDENYTDFWHYNHSNIDKIIIKRVIKNEVYDEEALRNKYLKICQDLYAKIKSLKELEGWDEKMVQEWLNENAKEYVPEFE
jgi:hypothetical protein